jgi:Tfp pilus assembly protein PilE
MTRSMSERGFTLIELMIVIAIVDESGVIRFTTGSSASSTSPPIGG